jgi:hypothetical protein
MKKGLRLSSFGLDAGRFPVRGCRQWRRVSTKIKALEQEFSSLKSQQMELKKEATTAAAGLPSFSYFSTRSSSVSDPVVSRKRKNKRNSCSFTWGGLNVKFSLQLFDSFLHTR